MVYHDQLLFSHIAGVDEAGRGPLAGPVIAAAVMLDANQPIEGLADSKKISEKKREALYTKITKKAFAWSVGRAEVEEIDRLNILQATLLAMQRAIANLTHMPQHVRIDGNKAPRLNVSVETIIGGDQKIPEISAASIIAKVTRDREMVTLDKCYPQYGFAQHKGYGTKQHLQALSIYGASSVHRHSFAPVRNSKPQSVIEDSKSR